MAPTMIRLLIFSIRFVITFIFVEIFEPPIIHVTGSFLLLITRFIASISFFKRGPAKLLFIYLVML